MTKAVGMQRWAVAALGLVVGAFLLLDSGAPAPRIPAAEAFAPAPPGLTLISHAGGGHPAGVYSNSLEALDRAYADGLRLLEIDFNWTRDGRLVLVHDWNNWYRAWFERPFWHAAYEGVSGKLMVPTLGEFRALVMRHGLTQLALADLLDWMRRHPDARIVTDIKSDNLAGLSRIAEAASELRARFVPQVYDFTEFEPVRALGFDSIIFTAYRSAADPDAIVAFANGQAIYAVTLPASRLTGAWAGIADRIGAPVFTHTVNDALLAADLARLGVAGLYTDYLVPTGPDEGVD